MPVLERLRNLLDRLGSYAWWEIAIELLLIGLVVWAIVRFVQGTRAAGAIKGLLFILVVGTLVVRVLGGGDSFARIGFLYDRILAIVAVALIVIFQPELRRALIRLGETSVFKASQSDIAVTASAVAPACVFLAKNRFGALIVIERGHGLKGLIEGGTQIDAEISHALLKTIFHPGTALHDLAVVVRGRRVMAAGVQLPMADPSDLPDAQLGSRHRAAVGITKESNALVVVVSEETGLIRFADHGRLSRPYDYDELEDELRHRLGYVEDAKRPTEADATATAMDDTDLGPPDERAKPDGVGLLAGGPEEGTR